MRHFLRRLTGPVPVCLAAAPKLQYLSLGGNALTGSVPAPPATTALLSLNMTGNQLIGAHMLLQPAGVRHTQLGHSLPKALFATPL